MKKKKERNNNKIRNAQIDVDGAVHIRRRSRSERSRIFMFFLCKFPVRMNKVLCDVMLCYATC